MNFYTQAEDFTNYDEKERLLKAIMQIPGVVYAGDWTAHEGDVYHVAVMCHNYAKDDVITAFSAVKYTEQPQ